MKLAWILFGLLLAMCVLVGYILVLPEPPGAAGVPHPEFHTMQQGGDGAARHAPVLGAGWLFGVLVIALLVALLALGARRPEKIDALRTALLVGLALFLAVFTIMVLAYRTYAHTPDPPLLLSFPRPTAWMLYALWPVPIFFLALYVLRFDSWIFPAEDLETFRRILGRRSERGQ